MNILFFLTPKNETAVVYEDYSVRQALEKMKFYGYSAIPMIDRNGVYKGTVTEGDFLRLITENIDEIDTEYKFTEHIRLSDMKRKTMSTAVSIDADIEELMDKAVNQNFVPVTDDKGVFIGIVTRKDIIQYLNKKLNTIESRALKGRSGMTKIKLNDYNLVMQ